MESEGKKINKWIIIGGIVVLILIIAILVSSQKKGSTVPGDKTPAGQTPSGETASSTEGTAVSAPELEGAVVEAPGASLVVEDKVVNSQGVEVKNDVSPMAPEAPQQSAPITDTSTLSEKVIKIEVSAEKGFQPSSFTVKAGQPVSVSVSAADEYTHVFAFKEPALSAVAVGIGSGPTEKTRVITFKAPEQKGEYVYYCNVPGHEGRGETGKMIVE
jgi:uncharacterized cupredoxin-like copper-binding protein